MKFPALRVLLIPNTTADHAIIYTNHIMIINLHVPSQYLLINIFTMLSSYRDTCSSKKESLAITILCLNSAFRFSTSVLFIT